MRWVAWAAALPLVARAGTITADEARCIVDGKTTIFFGDSLTRFCYYEFNTFLSTGAVRDHELGASSGDGRWSDDYDDWEEWTEEGICGAGGKHRRRIWMDLDETTRTEFYFINNVWYGSGGPGGRRRGRRRARHRRRRRQGAPRRGGRGGLNSIWTLPGETTIAPRALGVRASVSLRLHHIVQRQTEHLSSQMVS